MFGSRRWRWPAWRLRLPLRVNILLVFLAVFLPFSALVIAYNYTASRNLAVRAIGQRVRDISDRIVERNERFMLPAASLAEIYARTFSVASRSAIDSPDFPAGALQAMAFFPQVYAMYAGYQSGDFIHVVHFSDAEREAPDQPAWRRATHFAVRRIVSGPDSVRRERWEYLDQRQNVIHREQLGAAEYDPRVRPWYAPALESNQTIVSGPYIFAKSQQPGITFSHAISGQKPGVFGVDITLAEITSFLAVNRVGMAGRIFVFNVLGELVAGLGTNDELPAPGTPAAESVHDAALHVWAIVQTRLGEDRSVSQVTLGGVDHLAAVRILRLGNEAQFVVVVLAPLGELLNPIARISQFTMVISAVIGLLAVPLILWLATMVSRPILDLSRDARQITELRMGPTSAIASTVSEVHDLADSFATMKTTLDTFTRYVPRALVKDLLDSRQVPMLGGSSREITILFTDVQGFTRLVEGISPNELTLKMTSYFKVLGEVLLAKHATIAQFIGDSIMAFWNAPLDDANHAQHAAEAMLLCHKASQELNSRWESFGWPVMYTRFGSHTGAAVVGNIGLPDRMEYGAVGQNVNLASRLEGMNKAYGTQLLVSEHHLASLGPAFVHRHVDSVMPKGFTSPLRIHELVGMTGGAADIAPTPLQAELAALWNEEIISAYQARRWQTAIGHLRKYRRAFPEDRLAKLYTARCIRYAARPPGTAWDGVVRFRTK